MEESVKRPNIMDLYIAKNKNGFYYTTLKNEYKGKESKCTMTVQIPRSMTVETYGLYRVSFMLSCFEDKNGVVRPQIVVLSLVNNSYDDKESRFVQTDSAINEYNNVEGGIDFENFID